LVRRKGGLSDTGVVVDVDLAVQIVVTLLATEVFERLYRGFVIEEEEVAVVVVIEESCECGTETQLLDEEGVEHDVSMEDRVLALPLSLLLLLLDDGNWEVIDVSQLWKRRFGEYALLLSSLSEGKSSSSFIPTTRTPATRTTPSRK
jgi:hypothetical protein